MANLVSTDISTTTGSNIRLLREASSLSMWDTSQLKLREAIRAQEVATVETCDQWRIPYLCKLLERRQELYYLGEDVKKTDDLISSLCIN